MKNGLLKEGLVLLREHGASSTIFNSDPSFIINALERYIAEIELFNPAYKLVGTNDRKELIVKHILDSLSGLGVINRFAAVYAGTDVKIADAGSGAGLPGIPLAISLPSYHFTLLERMGRRAGFLNNTCAVLGIPNVTVEEKEIEKAAPNRFNIITFRAFKPLDNGAIKSLFRLLTPDGILIAYKGKKDTVEREFALLKATLHLPPSTKDDAAAHWEIIRVSVPFLKEERHIAVIPRVYKKSGIEQMAD
ncbi:MAG: 16S rRNA (guanine(527)-N(7))-methyltransferase RsmG [Treponema sp.]|jgi:16S rRNA (guanine527-N7)-methyltransferase|nr:16S rRNA (guanine(527)-N(7))-methyltransferase RsmG [Treponema sp.]